MKWCGIGFTAVAVLSSALAAGADCTPATGPIADVAIQAKARRLETATVLVELENKDVIALGTVGELEAYHNCIRPHGYIIRDCSTPDLRVYGEACPEGESMATSGWEVGKVGLTPIGIDPVASATLGLDVQESVLPMLWGAAIMVMIITMAVICTLARKRERTMEMRRTHDGEGARPDRCASCPCCGAPILHLNADAYGSTVWYTCECASSPRARRAIINATEALPIAERRRLIRELVGRDEEGARI